MAALKAYTVGNNGFVSRAVMDTLGAPRHHRQACVILIAGSKAAAVRAAETVGFHVSPNDGEFRVARDLLAESILDVAAGPSVCATALTARSGGPVVRLDGAAGVRVGELVREGYVLALNLDREA